MGLLSAVIFAPLLGGLGLYVTPRRWSRVVALAASGVTLLLSASLALGFRRDSGAMQFEERLAWLPSLGASYHVGVDGLSMPLIVLSALLTFLVVLYSRDVEDRPREFYLLFLLLGTGTIGVFATLDLLLFYVFWELSLVPMYFIIGIWGKARRMEAALKFFLYTRVGGLAILLSILALYLHVEPRSFDLPTIIAARPLAAAGSIASLVLLGLFIGFSIKLPVVPFHSWLPDAHTEAPTGGSVMLAGVLLKLGGYGFLRIALPTVPGAMSDWAWPLALLGAVSAIYGTLVAMGQTDIKRLVAYSSINEMGYVLIGVAAAAASWASPADRSTAATGAGYMLLAHGLATGALFFLVGSLESRTHEREMPKLGGLWMRMPRFGTLLATATFAALGIPGMAVFVAELQVLFGTLGPFPWVAALMLLAILIATAMFLWMLQRTLMGKLPDQWSGLPDLNARELVVLGTLVVALLLFGLWPGPLIQAMELASRTNIIGVITKTAP